jgi:hypothetical protein
MDVLHPMTDDGRRTTWGVLSFVLRLSSLVVLALLAVPQLWYPFGFDQGVYAACGDVIRRGGVPIQDCFETKQPGVMVMYAIPMLFSRAPMAVHAFTLLWTALTAVVVGQVAKRLFHPAAAWPAAIFYWLAYAGINYWSMDQGETFANLFLVLALYGAWRGADDRTQDTEHRPQTTDDGQRANNTLRRSSSVVRRRSSVWLLIGGACIGIAFWFKYVFGLIGLVLVVCLVVHTWIRTRSAGRAFANGLIFGLATLAVAGLGLLYYALNNAIPALVSQFQFLLAAFPLGPPRTLPEILAQLARFADNGADVTGDFKSTVPQWIVLGGGFPLMFALAFLGAWQRRKEPRAMGALAYLLAGFVAGAAVVAWQANYIQYHYTIMIPPLAIAASGADFRFWILGFGFNHKSKIQNLKSRPLAATMVVLVVVLLSLRMLPWLGDWYSNVVVLQKAPRDIYLESRVAPNVPLAEFINAHTAPDDSIAIFGDAPWVYTLAERHNATRFSFVNLWLRKREAVTYAIFTGEYLQGLERNRPLYFILTQPDFPWPNNDYIPDYKAATAIYNYVESNYAYEGENGPFLLFRRKS